MEEVPSSNYESIVAEKIRRRDWDEVPTYYSMMRCADAAMNCDGDTVLHLAISDRLYDIVKKLLLSLRHNPSMLERVLIAKDENGDTPLHIAANSRYIGFSEYIVNYFRLTGKHVQQLIMARNKDGETPLFVAIDHDHEYVFDYLSSFVGFEEEDECGYKWWRKNDATTILHVAIMSEHFKLAYKIVRKYQELWYHRNERGETPLHILASMPWAFRSGSPPLPLVEQFIYENTWTWTSEYDYTDVQQKRYPPVYTTCVDLFKLLRRPFQMIVRNLKGRATGIEAGQEKGIESSDGNNGEFNFYRRARFCKTVGDTVVKKFPKIIQRFVEFLYKRLITNAMVGYFVEMALIAPWKIGGLIFSPLKEVRKKAKTHYWANVVMKELLRLDDYYRERRNDIMRRDPCGTISSRMVRIEREETMVEIKREAVEMETPFLITAKTGITEMVQEILERFPNAIFDLRPRDRRNVLLIAVENRHVYLWDYLKDKYQDEKYSNWRTVLNKFDKDGNNVLHIAAMHSDERPWLMPGEMMKMHWDAKWFEYVAKDVPGSFRQKRNKCNKTPKEVFNKEHEEQQKKDVTEWLNTTAQACSVVAALIATVAYTSASTVPGGNKEDTGKPNFMKYTEFYVFLITTFIALSFSVSSIICFLALLVSGQRPSDYSTRLPRSLMWGVSTLIISIVAMLASFCAGQFLYFKGKRVPFLLPLYIVCFTVLIIVQIAQFPFFLGLRATVYLNKPRPCYSDDMVR